MILTVTLSIVATILFANACFVLRKNLLTTKQIVWSILVGLIISGILSVTVLT